MTKICNLQKFPISSEEFVRGLPILLTLYKNLPESFRYPLTSCNKSPKGCQEPLTHLQESCPNSIQSSHICVILVKKEKFKLKTRKQQIVFNTIRGLSPTKVISLHTTDSLFSILCDSTFNGVFE